MQLIFYGRKIAVFLQYKKQPVKHLLHSAGKKNTNYRKRY